MTGTWERKELIDCYYYYNDKCAKDNCDYRHCKAALLGSDDNPCIMWKMGKCLNIKCTNRHPNVTPKLKALWSQSSTTTITTPTKAPKKKEDDHVYTLAELQEIQKQKSMASNTTPMIGKIQKKPETTGTSVQRKILKKLNPPSSTTVYTGNNNSVSSASIPSPFGASTVSSPPPTSVSSSSSPPASPPLESTVTATIGGSLSPKRAREQDDSDSDESPEAKRQKFDPVDQTFQQQEQVQDNILMSEDDPIVDEEEIELLLSSIPELKKILDEIIVDEETYKIEFENEIQEYKRIFGTTI